MAGFLSSSKKKSFFKIQGNAVCRSFQNTAQGFLTYASIPADRQPYTARKGNMLSMQF